MRVAAIGVVLVLLPPTLSGCAPTESTAVTATTNPQSVSVATTPPGGSPSLAPGSTAAGPSTAPEGTPTTPSGPVAAPETRPAGFSRQPVSSGRLLLTTLTGLASGVRMRVWVWLPPEYDDPAHAGEDFPVLTLYPGGDGVNYTQFFDPQKVGIIVAGAASGRLSAFIIVEPQLQPSISLDTECTDLAGLPRVGTFMEQDVPAMLKASFRVARTPGGWGIGGVSSGAYCASRLLFARPDVWSVGASLGGYFQIDTPLPSGHTAAAVATSPQVVAATRAPAVRLRAWVGSADAHALQQNRSFMKVVRAPTQADLQIVAGGTHTWVTFQRLLPDMFAFFTAHLDRPQRPEVLRPHSAPQAALHESWSRAVHL